MQKTLVTIEQKQLARVLGTMGSVINAKSTLPILADVILSYDKERKVFQLAASDMENWLYIDCVDPQTGEPWIKLIEDAPKDPFTSVAINLRQLKEATGQLPSACVLQVTFTGNDHVMNIVHQTGHMSMPWEDADQRRPRAALHDADRPPAATHEAGRYVRRQRRAAPRDERCGTGLLR